MFLLQTLRMGSFFGVHTHAFSLSLSMQFIGNTAVSKRLEFVSKYLRYQSANEPFADVVDAQARTSLV